MQAPPQSARAAAQLGAGPERKKPTVASRWHHILSYRLRAYFPRLLVLEVGRASIVYSGRLALSDEELRVARECDMAATAEADVPIRIVSIGQVNAGKSSLPNAIARESRGAVGPSPATSSAKEYLIDMDGRPCVLLVDTPGSDESAVTVSELISQAGRAHLIIWVAAATQPARGPDRKRLDDFRAWANAQLARRPPPVLLALTHVDELDPRWSGRPPTTSAHRPGRRREPSAAPWMLSLVPSACPWTQSCRLQCLLAGTIIMSTLYGRKSGAALDEAKLVQLDRLRVGQQRLSWRELADAFGHAGRTIIKGLTVRS